MTYQHGDILVFDIETIPDATPELLNNLTGSESTEISDIRHELERYHLDITDGKNPFLRQLFHRVVAISFVHAKIEKLDNYQEYYHIQSIRSGGTINSSEQELVEGFFFYLRKMKPRLVSFNGRGFDLPVLKYRAMKHGVNADFLYRLGDKWSNYLQRYSMEWHCDLIEVLSDYGASARIKMNEVCALLGFPGKVGTDGSKVTDMFDAGKIDEIRNYCETDVINTFLIYANMMQHRGVLSAENYNKILYHDLYHLLNDSAKEHFQEFLDAWRDLDQGTNFS